jgi:hypothetical protein
MNVLFIILNDLDLLDNILEDLYHIFTVIENSDKYDKAVTMVKKHLESSRHHSSGFMFSVPVSNIYPISKH